MAFDRLLADLSAGFVNLAADKVDAAITEALRRIAARLGVDRTQLIRFSADGSALRVTHSGALQGIAEGAPDVSLLMAFPWAVRRLRAGQVTAIERMDELPAEAEVDCRTWRRYGLKSELIVPLYVDGQLDGTLTLDCDRHERRWPADLIERMQVLATIFGNALAHKQARESLDAAVRFERRATQILSRLLASTAAEHDRVVEAGLRDVADELGADWATLWQCSGDPPTLVKTHLGRAATLSPQPLPDAAPHLPWIVRQLFEGRWVRFARLPDLPRDAAADVQTLQALGIGAALVVPLVVNDKIAGALSLSTQREGVDWPQLLLDRVRLLGEAFAAFLSLHESQRRELDALAQAAHAARVGTLGVVAASLVHELTQPLSAGLANAESAAELLAAAWPDLDELRATVSDLVADERRAAELVQQLRRFLRREQGEQREVDLQTLLREVMPLVAARAAEYGTEIELDLPGTLPTLIGDAVQLQQVLLNLLLNALDAVAAVAPGRRRVALRARELQGGWGIEVADTGPGIDPALRPRIFQPFFTTKAGGMGLGLAICQTIVAGHGGTLSVDDAPAGESGTVFRVELPAHAQPALGPRPIGGSRTPVDAATVFVIDDDDTVRRALERQLQAAGHRVQSFATATAFVERSPQDEPACIVCDLCMPGLSGLDLQATLARAGCELPMIFVSGQADVPTTAQAMKAGAVAFLAKPCSQAVLLAAVDDALERSRALIERRLGLADVQARYRSLSPREREVMQLACSGLLNKLIADRLGIAEATVKIHRGRVMAKMQARSLAELVRLAQRVAAPEGRAA